MASGLGWQRIATKAGVPQSTLRALLYGGPKPRQYTHIMTAKRLLALSVTLNDFAGRAQVDGTITRRKLEALIAIGWSAQKIGAMLGIRRQHVKLMLIRPTVSAHRARAVRDLFEKMWNTPPARLTVEDKRSYTSTIRLAEAKGYRRPMDWVDIDDLDEQPVDEVDDYIDEVAVRRVVDGGDPSILTATERLAAALVLMRVKGYSPNGAARRLRMSYKKVLELAA
jgi:hypothetical protein